MDKHQFRKQLLSIRNNLNNKNILSKKICYKIIEYIEANYQDPKIASFLSLKNEIDTTSINKHFKNIYLPIIHPFIRHGLWFSKNTNKYYLNKYKIKEPFYTPQNILAAWELDIIIVPVVGFNVEKYRMGMGGGFYDYSLSFKKDHKSPLTIGIAFDEQQNNAIIINKYDIKLDIIITPTRIL